MKKILGLDIGTNSIGGCLINIPEKFEDYGKKGNIEWIGSRIIPMDTEMITRFVSGQKIGTDNGVAISPTAKRRVKRGSRRLKQRYILRRTRLIKVFKILKWVDESFPDNFKNQLRNNSEFKFKISSFLPFKEATIKEATKLLGVINKKGDLAISEDWIIYYLRKKALKEKISIQELARIIYMMNQRRGFKSGRKDLKNSEENLNEKKWVEILTIESVIEKRDSEKSKDGKYTFEIKAGKHIWEVKRKIKPEWEGKQFTLLFTEKNGKILQPKVPSEDEWEMTMVALDNRLENSDKHVGEFFFDELVKDKNYKIRQQVIKRIRYEKELEAIWKKQSEFHSELSSKKMLSDIATELYKVNSTKQKEITDNDLFNLISKDIIYYQRDLKSQKNLISGCRYEKVKYRKDGELKIAGAKAAPTSSPEFQEFRIWQDIHNIRIIAKEKNVNGKDQIRVDVTKDYISLEVKENLFNLFDTSKEVTSQNIFNEVNKNDLSDSTHKINLYENRTLLKGNETKYIFRKVFGKFNFMEEGEKLLQNKKLFYKLWHIIYSITSTDSAKSEKGIITALTNPKNGFDLPKGIVSELSKTSELIKDYKSFSSKALRKMLEVMRCGNRWSDKMINQKTKNRIEKLINGEFDEDLDDFTRDKVIKFFRNERNKKLGDLKIDDFQGLPTWLSCYVVYGIHSERKETKKYESNKDIDVMKLLPNNSLRNPIVELVIRETLHLVKDVWERYGQPDEIHIELGRELKKNAEDRKKISEMNNQNRDEKERIKLILHELINESFEEYIEPDRKIKSNFEVKPNPESPMDIEKFRIWKSCSGIKHEELDKLFKDGKKERIPTISEIKKYTLWLSQKCISPYTGKIIQLSKLFTNEYSVEHIIPRSKLKYDSLDNLVICESAINPDPYKGNKLARLFIRENSGQNLKINGIDYKIFIEDDYIQNCKNIFKGSKLKNLLAEEIPEGFISRQLNDTRYITKKLTELLYPIAKEKDGLIFTIGSITNELKQNWKLNEVWKNLLKPRFERMERIMNKKFIYQDENDKSKFHIQVSEDPKFELKRIDHRHHALDALIVASTTREHIRFLSSLNAVDNDEELKNVKRKLVKGKIRDFNLPWPNYTIDAADKLRDIIVTFKAHNKVITKPKNRYLKWINKNGTWEKELVKQVSNKKWLAVRKSIFSENPQGVIYLKHIKEVKLNKAIEIELRRRDDQNTPKQKTASYIYDKESREIIKLLIERIGDNLDDINKFLKKNKLTNYSGDIIEKVKVAEFEEYAAKRVSIDKSFTRDKIDKIPYSKEGKSTLADLLHSHLKEYSNKPNEAFEGEGLEKLYKKIKTPINKLTIFEKKSDPIKFQGKIFEPDAGSIVYFVIYENEITKERKEMYSLSVHKVIERFIQRKSIADKKEGFKTIILSPEDLVYVPTLVELEKIKQNIPNPIDWNNKKIISDRIYKMVSSSKRDCLFIRHDISKPIVPYDRKLKIKGEIDWNDKSTKTMDGKTTISNCCIKLKIDRLGNIKPNT